MMLRILKQPQAVDEIFCACSDQQPRKTEIDTGKTDTQDKRISRDQMHNYHLKHERA